MARILSFSHQDRVFVFCVWSMNALLILHRLFLILVVAFSLRVHALQIANRHVVISTVNTANGLRVRILRSFFDWKTISHPLTPAALTGAAFESLPWRHKCQLWSQERADTWLARQRGDGWISLVLLPSCSFLLPHWWTSRTNWANRRPRRCCWQAPSVSPSRQECSVRCSPSLRSTQSRRCSGWLPVLDLEPVGRPMRDLTGCWTWSSHAHDGLTKTWSDCTYSRFRPPIHRSPHKRVSEWLSWTWTAVFGPYQSGTPSNVAFLVALRLPSASCSVRRKRGFVWCSHLSSASCDRSRCHRPGRNESSNSAPPPLPRDLHCLQSTWRPGVCWAELRERQLQFAAGTLPTNTRVAGHLLPAERTLGRRVPTPSSSPRRSLPTRASRHGLSSVIRSPSDFDGQSKTRNLHVHASISLSYITGGKTNSASDSFERPEWETFEL